MSNEEKTNKDGENEENEENEKDIRFDKRLAEIFDDVISLGCVTKEGDIGKGITIKVRALDADEVAMAESMYNATVPDERLEERLRILSILAMSIVAFNGKDVYPDNINEDDKKLIRQKVFDKLSKLAPKLIDNAYVLYGDCVKEQNDLFETENGVDDATENF